MNDFNQLNLHLFDKFNLKTITIFLHRNIQMIT